jgi:cytochrome P450
MGRLRDDPEGLSASATEEILRASSVTMHFRRTATEEVEMRGKTIAAGDRVVMWYPSANHDEEVFDEPFRFDIRREPNDHLAFGTGRHLCLGASLARLEVRVVFEELLRRVASVEIIGEPDRLRSNFINGIKHLPVRVVLA